MQMEEAPSRMSCVKPENPLHKDVIVRLKLQASAPCISALHRMSAGDFLCSKALGSLKLEAQQLLPTEAEGFSRRREARIVLRSGRAQRNSYSMWIVAVAPSGHAV
jgi:hypothetical protein